MTTLPQMGLDLPVRGAPGSGVWDDTLDADLAKIDAHSHVTGQGTAVPTAGLNINADLTFGGLWAPIHLHRITFDSITAIGSNNKSLFVSDGTGGLSANELYWRSNGGTNVRLTLGSALNVAAFVGGIGGDYSAVSAALNYDSSGLRYTFKGAAGTNWQRLASGEVRLFETNTAETVFVGLAAPAALAASYTVTWPLAVPGATSLVQMDTAGVLTAVNTGVNGLTLTANQHVTISGTGQFKHGTRTLQIAAPGFTAADSPTMTYGANGETFQRSAGTGAITVFAPILLDVGKRITAIRSFIFDSVTGPTKLQASFVSVVGSTAVATTVASSSVSAGNSTFQTLTIGSLTTTVTSGSTYLLKITTTTGTDTNGVIMAEVDYDNP